MNRVIQSTIYEKKEPMNIFIEHYEPEQNKPYNRESYFAVSNIRWNSKTKELSFVDVEGFRFHAKYSHPVIIDIVETEG